MPEQKFFGYHLEHLRSALGQHFDLQYQIGTGAFASVYLAKNLKLGRLEALKILFDRGDANFGKRFAAEVKLVASLDHPNIVKVYDHGEAEGFIWCSMQLIEGPTLRDELEQRLTFSQDEVASLTIPLLDALAYSHVLGTVHRDVKPSNVILDRRGQPFLMDFGIAKSMQSTLLTSTRGILGTPTYISPEQLSRKTLDGRADLYSLAVMMYEMLTGEPPFVADDVVQTVVKRLMQDPEPISAHLPEIDSRLEAIVMQGLARKPEHRFADALAMREALIEVMGSEWRKITPPVPSSRIRVGDQRISDEKLAEEATTVMENAVGELGSSPRRRVAIGAALFVLVVLTLAVLVARFKPNTESRQPGSTSVPQSEASVPLGDSPAELLGESAADDSNEGLSGDSSVDPQVLESVPVGELEVGGAQRDSARVAKTEEVLEPQEALSTPESEIVGAAPKAPVPRPPPEEILRPSFPPRLLSAVESELNPQAAAQCAGVEVILTVRVDKDGAVDRARTLLNPEKVCADAAERAVRKYEFEPARGAEGQALPGSITISFRFSETQP